MHSAGTRRLTVSEIIDQRPLSRFQLSTITLCGLVLLLAERPIGRDVVPELRGIVALADDG